MAASNEIRRRLGAYLSNEIALDGFEDWFVQNSWDAHRSDAETRRLVHAIELRLSEFSSGHLTEESLREELIPFVTFVSPEIVYGEAILVTSQATVDWQQQVALVADPVTEGTVNWQRQVVLPA